MRTYTWTYTFNTTWLWMVDMRCVVKLNLILLYLTPPAPHTHTRTHMLQHCMHPGVTPPAGCSSPPCLVCILQFLSSLSSMGSCLLFSCVCDLRWQIKWLTSPPAHWSDILMVFWVKGVSGHHTSERVVDVKLGLGRIPTRKTMHYVLVIHQTGLMIRSIFEDISSVINLQ